MTIENHRLKEAQFVPSPNVGSALKKPSLITGHYTAGRSAAKSAQWLCSKAAKASCHLILGRAGELYQLVSFDRVAWHAGPSKHGKLTGINNHSFGLELDNYGRLTRVNGKWRALALGVDVSDADVLVDEHGRGWHMYTPVQLALFETICRELIEAYPTVSDLVGHEEICVPKFRKLDPGPALDLEHFRSRLFGRV